MWNPTLAVTSCRYEVSLPWELRRRAIPPTGNTSYVYVDARLTSASQRRDDFATYWNDHTAGFQYVVNRYYSTGYGRFLTVDPATASAGANDPGTWNRYSYGGVTLSITPIQRESTLARAV